MCPTNNEKVGFKCSSTRPVARILTSQQRVCKSSVEHLCIPGTKIVFGPGCKRFMWQHVIRFQLCPKHTIFKRWGDIALKLYAVRPDGSSWTETWDLVIRPKIQTAMNRCASEAVKLGLVREEDGERVWENWAKGFLSDEWDGSTFDEDYARRLLQKVSDAEDAERRGREHDNDRITAIREAREKLLEEIFFLEDVIDDRRRPFGARPRRYPGQGLVYKYFLGGDGPSPAIEARVLEAQRPYL
ncbi:hypothetical protein GCG54_00003815 [Colletotrichum gloeosporioides]|uniref:Uncharacterized protein n=1 Tax=Colletotrichum gloeosporioides TaxID=474922 RepID=A0A8H4FIM3_COLGL|nr:uncharacterized protein GCG54_00003815 [Colletotrichum gloeosporioides]KAF3802354.1 hypothetical protein GCG54_00003815 [Colletotrichum gloeosporioides]